MGGIFSKMSVTAANCPRTVGYKRGGGDSTRMKVP